MWKDPIVEETRRLREEYAAEHNHDIEAIFRDAQRRQEASTRKVVTLPSRKPRYRPPAA